MNALYVTSVEPFIGKTALCLALGRRLQQDGYRVGYLKPMSVQPWRTPEGTWADEDAAFVRSALGLEVALEEMAPVIVTSIALRQRLKGAAEDLLERIQRAAARAGEGKDVLLLEGGSSLREGYTMGLSNVRLAEVLGAPVLVLVRYRTEMQVTDDALASRARLGKLMQGVILNRVPQEAMQYVEHHARPFLEREAVHVLGVLPSVARLSALTVGELIRRLEAQVLTRNVNHQALVENFSVGAMTIDAALTRFRRQPNKAVITGGDRTDIQLAALETSTVALILTGNLQPSPLVLQQAEALGVAVLLVRQNTIDAVNQIEAAYGKTRLAEPEKLEEFIRLTAEHVNLSAIYQALGLKSKG
ncbi:MAG: phosphotransacetylase family protein [Chloroflexota bacterium]